MIAIFHADKYHSVSRIEAGLRRVLVLELWNGDEKLCNHRCTVAHGSCEGLAIGVAEQEPSSQMAAWGPQARG